MTAKKLISLRISKATEDKLRWLAARHGTQTEAMAVAIDRLYESDYNKERTMDIDGSELYTLFANDAEFDDIAKQSVREIADQLGKFRDGDCHIPMTTWDIAQAIRKYARERVLADENIPPNENVGGGPN